MNEEERKTAEAYARFMNEEVPVDYAGEKRFPWEGQKQDWQEPFKEETVVKEVDEAINVPPPTLEELRARAEKEYATKIEKRRIENIASQKGIPEEELARGFLNEYKRVLKALGEGRGRNEDIYVLRELKKEAQLYGVDEDLLSQITNLRRKMTTQSVLKKGAEAVGGIGKYTGAGVASAAALATGGSITRDQAGNITIRRAQRTGTGSGAPNLFATGIRPARSSEILSPSVAKNIFDVPVRRASPGVAFDTYSIRNMIDTPVQRVGRVRMPTLREMLGV